jgi:iron-sulfur cluster insertion protein
MLHDRIPEWNAWVLLVNAFLTIHSGACMSGIATFTPMPLYISDNASEKVKALVEEEGNPDLKLRVFVTGGGCSGFQYGFSFDEVTAEDDTLVSKDGVAVVVDPLSFQYLSGSTVDYEEGLQGSRFTITNPNATTTCGCGSSFSV